MKHSVGDKFAPKETSTSFGVEVVMVWERLSEALAYDPVNLGPLLEVLPENVSREQPFYSVFIPSRGGCLLVGEEQLAEGWNKIEA